MAEPAPEGRDRRSGIVQAAIEVFADHGFAGASFSILAGAAGLEKGHLTYYFPSKQDLLFEIVEDLHTRFLDGVRVWSTHPGDEITRLRYVFEQHVRLVLASTAQTRVAYDSFRFLTGDRRNAIVRCRNEYEHAIRDLVDDASASPSQALGLVTKNVLAQLNWPYQWFSSSGPLTAEEVARFVADRAVASVIGRLD